MPQVTFMFDDDGRIVSGVNSNTTSAITAGDILYASPPSTSPFGTTVPGAVDPIRVIVEPIKFATAATLGKDIVGIAMHDAAKSTTTLEPISFATEGLFLSKVVDTTAFVRAGRRLRPSQGNTTAGVTNSETTTLPDNSATEQTRSTMLKIGYALTSANTDGHYILWKFSK